MEDYILDANSEYAALFKLLEDNNVTLTTRYVNDYDSYLFTLKDNHNDRIKAYEYVEASKLPDDATYVLERLIEDIKIAREEGENS